MRAFKVILGLRRTVLITVGRVSDHAVRIRLGAENAGPKGLALVPRSYNISLLILTRWDEFDEAKRVKSIEAVTYTSLVSIEDGSTLRSSRNREELAKRVKKSIHNFGFGVVLNQCIERVIQQGTPNNCKEITYNENASLTAEEIDDNLNLLRAVDRADYGEITSCLCQQPNIDLPREIRLRRLLVDLIEAQFDSRYSKLLVPLEERTAPMLPASDQLGLYTDDKAQLMAVSLRGGEGLNSKNLRAELLLKGGRAKLVPVSISMTGDGAQTEIKFPSIAQANLLFDDLEDRPLALLYRNMTARYTLKEAKTAEKVAGPTGSLEQNGDSAGSRK